MAMLQTTLADELQALGLYDNEPDAIQAWADAFAAYFEDAESNAVIIASAAIPAAKAAMVSAMTGLSTAGAAAIQAGIVAFWGALVPATAWLTTTAITPPPGLSGLTAALQAVFDANTTGGLSKDASMTAIAGAIHPINAVGGAATWPGLGPQPIA
jgi:hypothetical protein